MRVVSMIVYLFCLFVFFFKQKTAYEMRISDWSSDVCSSDLMTWSPYSLVKDDLAPRGRLIRAGDESWDIPTEIRLFRPRARQDPRAEAFWSFLTDNPPSGGAT